MIYHNDKYYHYTIIQFFLFRLRLSRGEKNRTSNFTLKHISLLLDSLLHRLGVNLNFFLSKANMKDISNTLLTLTS